MPDWDALARGFDYDLWANMRWFEWLEEKGWPEPDRAIFIHILGAEQVWLSRFGGTSPTTFPTPAPTVETLEQLRTSWKGELLAQTDDVILEYKRINGEPHQAPLSEIARHVVNHGTYHRGELRGLCRARDDSTFPDTDYSIFAQLKPLGT